MTKKIALLPGDGVGPEIIKEAVKVLEVISKKFGFKLDFQEFPVGGNAIDATGDPLPKQTLQGCKQSDAALLGAVGGPKWDSTDPAKKRPEDGLLALRKGLGLFANLRPVKASKYLARASTLKEDVVSSIDLIIVRELTGGIYFGKRGRSDSQAFDTCAYSETEIDRIVRKGFEIALTRKSKLTSVDKANVLESSRFWRERAVSINDEYPQVELNHMLVDNCAMQLIREPSQFDVIVTENMFGDILSDEASMLTGSIGMLPSASLGEKNTGLFEPIHGSAPDIAGKNKANPIGMILSSAMLLRYSMGQKQAADAVERSVERVLEKGYRTPDIMVKGKTSDIRLQTSEKTEETKEVGTEEMGSLIAELI